LCIVISNFNLISFHIDTHIIERVKIVLQTQAAAGTNYKGMIDCGSSIVKNQGISGLWTGNTINCMRYFPTTAMNFAFKEKYQNFFVPERTKDNFGRWFGGYLLAGGAAGATSLTVAYPLEFAYTRVAADVGNKQFTGMTDCFTKIFKKDGIRGLYKGYTPSVAGIIVYRAGYFGFYDAGKEVFFKDPTKASIFAKFGLAIFVDISAACIAYPLDTIRRRLMMQSGREASTVQYTTSLGALKHIMKNEGGVAALYKGVFANNIRAIASAMVLVLYDEVRKVL
jgi:solute carrier family 25 (mitochondrial adenine nucleotide translocator), member 4/5/6/31